MPPCTIPNRAFGLARASNSLRERRAQRSDSSIEAAASSRVAGYGVHSSNTMAISESSARWTCIEISGVSSRRSPLTGDANATPSSRTLRKAPRLQTWKPPESVRSERCQPMKRCRPRCAAITSIPGRSQRWNVLPSTICAPSASSSFGAIALTVPYVPTGMNTGVSTAPCAVSSRPRARAAGRRLQRELHRGDCSSASWGPRWRCAPSPRGSAQFALGTARRAQSMSGARSSSIASP